MNLDFLHSYALEGQLSFWNRGQDAVSWSVDNQVAVVHKTGVNIFECYPSPGVQRQPPVLTTHPSQIDGPGHPFVPDTGSIVAEDIMSSREKQKIFELLKDPILRPHGYDGMLIPNDYIRAKWSLHPFYRGLHSESRCLLGLLTSNHDLVLYRRCNRRYSARKGYTDPWAIVKDLSFFYNQILLESWSTEYEDAFDEYKSRLYQLAIVDFLWMPEWDLETDHVTNNSDEMRATFKSCLMTFQANGEACIWEIQASKMELPSYTLYLLSTCKILCEKDDCFASAEFLKVSNKLGLLIVGTAKGTIKGIFIEKNVNGNGEINYTFHVNSAVSIWGDVDMMKIDNLLLTKNAIKGWKLAAVKHPNILLATSIFIKEETRELLFDDVSFVRLSGGPIVGLSTTIEEYFVVSHESGSISTVAWNDCEKILKEIPDSKIELFDPCQIKQRKTVIIGAPVQKSVEKSKKKYKMFGEKRLVFQGLKISPNKTLLCIARSLGVYYDHLKIRQPSHLVFYSLLPKDSIWSHVQKLYAENRYSLKAMSDVLVPLRFYLRNNDGEGIYKEIFASMYPMSERTTEELRLFYWCLKVKPGIPSTDWDVANAEIMFNPKATRRLVAIEKLMSYRLETVVDRIMIRRCASLVKAVVQNQHIPGFDLSIEINKQSLRAIYKFLNSKNPVPCNVTYPACPIFHPPPSLPLCYWCKGPIEYPTEFLEHSSPVSQYSDVLDEEELVSPVDEERITGFTWNERRHPIKESGCHVPELCVLSLIPIQFPYRRCPNCPVTCLMEPAFGQLPYCPLCNSFMFPIQLPMSDSKVRPEEYQEAENEAQSSTIFIKSEPQDIPSNSETLEVYPSDQPSQHYQRVMVIPAIPCEPVGMEWADQEISSDEDMEEDEGEDEDVEDEEEDGEDEDEDVEVEEDNDEDVEVEEDNDEDVEVEEDDDEDVEVEEDDDEDEDKDVEGEEEGDKSDEVEDEVSVIEEVG